MRRCYTIDGKSMQSARLEDYYAGLVSEYGLLTLEDPFSEEALDDFVSITRRLGKEVKVVGDDTYVTKISRIEEGIELGATNAVLIKLNQIGP